MSNFDIQHAHKAQFSTLLYELKIAKYEHPEFYDYLAGIVNRQREMIISWAGLDDLPPVPSKDDTGPPCAY